MPGSAADLRRVARGVVLALTVLIVPAALGAAGAPVEPAVDLHAYWDARCQSCHGDAGPFARSTLRVDGTRVLGRHHVDDLENFLRQHYLADAYRQPVLRMLTAQVRTEPLYRTHCAGCHGVAADFVRQRLALQGDVPVVRGSGRAVSDVLAGHGSLPADGRAVVVDSLRRVLGETGAR